MRQFGRPALTSSVAPRTVGEGRRELVIDRLERAGAGLLGVPRKPGDADQVPGRTGLAPGSRAPELTVTGTDIAATNLGELTAQGCGLLLFVSQECPTSMLAVGNLGPLCRSWESAGLTVTAVFEDPLDVALRVARALGWTGGVVSQDPPYPTSRDYGLLSVPTAVLVGRDRTIMG